MKRRIVVVMAVALFALFIASFGTAAETGIEGRVLVAVPGDHPIPDAVVTSTAPADGEPKGTKTDREGRFRFRDLKPGTYSLTVSAGGFMPRTELPVTAIEGATTPVEVRMRRVGASATAGPSFESVPTPLAQHFEPVPTPLAQQAAPKASRGAAVYSSVVDSISASRGGFGRTLVVPAGQAKWADLAPIAKDMGIMSRIFDKNLSKEFGDDFQRSFGNVLFYGGTTAQGVYLEGYGVLFLLRVRFPVAAAPPQEEVVERPAVDTVWVDVEQELFGKGVPNYDATKVENLQKTVLETLKHAANIRNLKPEESIAVAVLGDALSGDSRISAVTLGGHPYSLAGRALGDETSGTVLTVHVKRADVDAFARGQLSFEDFRQQATILAY